MIDGAMRNSQELTVEIRLEEGVVFGATAEQELLLDFYDPGPGDGLRPAVVWVHGGGWRNGSRQSPYARLIAELVQRHHIPVASIDYRLSGCAPFPAAIEDVKCALRWVRSQAAARHLDPARIVVAGASAGGHLAMLAAATNGRPEYEGNGGHHSWSSAVDVAIPCCGVSDVRDWAQQPDHVDLTTQFMGGTLAEVPERYALASPMEQLHPGMPPTLLVHGDADPTVLPDQSIRMHAAMQQLGLAPELILVPGVGHGVLAESPHQRQALSQIDAFLQLHLSLL